MGRTVYGPEDIPLSLERQEELNEGWEDLDSESTFGDIPEDEESLGDRCRKIVEELPNPSKREQIVAICLTLGDEEGTISRRFIADDVIDCSRSYALKFEYLPDEQVVVEPTSIDRDLRYELFGRHEECQRCGSSEDLEIHHIIPNSEGGEDTRENLAVLCRPCHHEAHGGTWNGVDYDSKSEFMNWMRYSNPE